jgi:hypothetical protein
MPDYLGKRTYGVVIPAGEHRTYNLSLVGKYLSKQTKQPDEIVLVCDGWSNHWDFTEHFDSSITRLVRMEKYEPNGLHEQPRNVGVRWLGDDIDFAWFLDSDCIPDKGALQAIEDAQAQGPPRVLICPYEWLPPDTRKPVHKLYNDPRKNMFQEYDPSHVAVGDLSFALACFSGNLVWPVADFKRVGGYWNEIHTGRCEDGELGLRAASLGVPMSVCPDARAWHLYHERNEALIERRNARDVPMLNARHPWVEEKGIVVTEKDGARFDIVCPSCKEQINTLEIWEHKCQIH